MSRPHGLFGTNMTTRCIIVDDSPTDAYLAQKIAVELFDEVLVVAKSADLLKHIGAFRPDIVFMDVMLGWENGLSLIQEVRHRDDESSIVPFAVLSARAARKTSSGLSGRVLGRMSLSRLPAIGWKLRSEGYSSAGPGLQA